MSQPTVVTVGADMFADSVAGQAVDVERVDWRPPMPGTEADLVTVATDPRRADANRRAVEAMLGVTAHLVDVAPASEVLGLEKGLFLHAGPPIEWARTSGPLRGALMGGAALDVHVDDPEDAVALFESGSAVSLEPCHHSSAVGPHERQIGLRVPPVDRKDDPLAHRPAPADTVSSASRLSSSVPDTSS